MRTPPKRPAAASPTGGAGSGRAEPDPRRLLGVWRCVGLVTSDLLGRLLAARRPLPAALSVRSAG